MRIPDQGCDTAVLPELEQPVSTRSPLVSVVIPTRFRPLLVLRAVRSALDQTLREIEVIVVIDGDDPATVQALNEVCNERLRVVPLERNVGGSEARNIGVQLANAQWIAFLDDDDEWMPEKLEKQWQAAQQVATRFVLVASHFIERSEHAERILPGRLPARGENFSEYMFVRRGWSSAEGFLQTSCWLVSRPLMIRVPFTPGLKRCQDLDWLLHATALSETEVLILPEVLAVFHHDERVERVSRLADWKFLYEWATLNRSCFSATAYSFFIATFCVPSASAQRAALRTFFFLFGECFFRGRRQAKCLSLFLICWWISETQRRSLRNWVQNLRHGLIRKAAPAEVGQPLSKARVAG